MMCLNVNVTFVVRSFKWCCKGSDFATCACSARVNWVRQCNARMLMKNSELLGGVLCRE